MRVWENAVKEVFNINKKFFLLMAFLLIFSSVSYANVCEVDGVRQALKKNLYIYFTDPSLSPLTLNEVKDLLYFYLGISESEVTVDCSVAGSRSSEPVSDIVNKGENVTDIVPTCADGTKYGECSTFRPKYCYGGSLLYRCNYCGCPSLSGCTASGKCEPITENIACSNDLDCGTSGFAGNYYCNGNYVSRSYLNYTCKNPGTTSSNCVSSNSSIKLNYCNPDLNQLCVDGAGDCQVNGNQTTTTCTDYDNGDNLFIASYAKKGTQAQYDKCGTAGQNYEIIEGVCTNGQLSGVPHSCPSGTVCKDVRYESAVNANVSACVNTTKITNVRCEIDYNSNVQNNVKCTVDYLGQIASCTIPAASSGYHLCDPTPLIMIAQPEPNVGYSPVSGLSGTFENISCGTIGTAYNTNYYFVNCKNPSNLNQTKTNLSVTLISPNGGEVWTPGNTYLIQWKHPLEGGFSGDKNMAWSINLYRPGDGSWDSGLPYIPINQSSYQWTIPTTLPSASDYKARIFLNKACIYSTSPCPEPSQILPDGSSDDSDAPLTVQATSLQTCTGVSKTVDFENPPHLSFHLTWNPDLGAQDSYNYNLDETARAWLKGKGLVINGTPNGIVWGTKHSGPAGTTGVVIGDASPNFVENDQGISDNEILSVRFMDALTKSVTVGLTVIPSTVSLINNIPATVVLEAYDTSNNIVGTATKTFTGVTNSVYTPTTMSLSAAEFKIAKITLRATQHPYGGVWLEDVSFLSCT